MDRKRILTIILIILGSLLAALGSILINVATNQSLPIVKLSLPLLWALVGIVTTAGICVAVFFHHLQTTQDRKKSTPENQNRHRMLAKVRAYWINGVLEQSLHGAALMTLGMHEQPDAVADPWRLILYQLGRTERALPSGTRITQVYDNVGGELLILGEPGSGKTTLLLELARDLLDRANRDDNHPIPVVLNLASWSIKRQALTKWLVEELNVKYQVPRKLSQSWVDADMILLLLDGLDEVSREYREACVNTINSFRQEHGLVSIVVCSRSTEYLSLMRHLLLQGAVVVEPLTNEQIEDYLSSAGGKLAAIQRAFKEDKLIQELATTPLMLSVMTLAYQDISVESFVMPDTLTTRRKEVFATYVQRMLIRRKTKRHYEQKQTLHWLTWLARQLTKHNQTEFYLERMQFDWLQESNPLRFYLIIIVGLIFGSFSGLMYGFIFALNFGQSTKFKPLTGVICGLLIGLFNWFIYVLLNSMIFGLYSKLDTWIPSISRFVFLLNILRALNKFLNDKFVYGVIFGLLNAIFIGLIIIVNNSITSPNAGFVFGGINGMCFGVGYGIIGKLNTEIQPAEIFTWSWRSVRQNIVKSLVAAVLIGLFWGPLIALTKGNISEYLALGFIYGLIFGSSLLIISGLSNETLSKQKLFTPNQGIKNSLRNGLLVGIINGAVYGLIFGSIFALTINLFAGLFYGFTFGLTAFAFLWVLKGGMACILHTLLRLRLCYEGSIPWRYIRFLDYATECILLRKVGGGYIFIHRLLLEYLANSEITLN